MQFFITAFDGKEEGILEKRMSIRLEHLENLKKVKEKGSVLCGGGINDDNGKLIGSYLVMEFPSRKELDEYLASEPFIINKVWKDISIHTCKNVFMYDEYVWKD